jgi:F-type H+-transporting ATPase subunit epsilon
MEKIKLKIVTPDKIIYENDAVGQITIPTSTGEITILPNHIPLISTIQPGELTISQPEGAKHFAIVGGFVEMKNNNELYILADNAELAEEIDVDRAEQARKKAAEQMEQIKNKEDVDYARLQAVIDREMNRLKIGKKYKNLQRQVK